MNNHLDGPPRKWRRLGVALCIGLSSIAVGAVGAGVAHAATTCGYTAYKNSTFSFAGIDLWRHEARGAVCEDNTNIVDVRPYINRIVKVGIGNVYRNEAWDDKGYTPARSSFNRLNGRSGMYVDVPIIGQIGVCRTRSVTFNWSMSGSAAVYTTSDSGWNHSC